MVANRAGRWCALALAGWIAAAGVAHADTSLLNVSYDVTRELYKDIDAAFVASYKQGTGETVEIKQSHGASSAQAMAVTQGLQADVVTMNQSNDIDLLHERGDFVPADWRTKFPDNSSPYTTTMIFLVRKGNPKQIKDWNDLVKPGVQVVIPNPKTSGNGRYSYLAAWGYVMTHGGNEAQARDFETRLFRNVPVLDTGGRGATTTFMQRDIGDVLVTFENEAVLIGKDLGKGEFETVYPSSSLLAEPPVRDRRQGRGQARHTQGRAGLSRLPVLARRQEIIAEHNLRPRNPAVLARHADQFKPLKTFTVEQVFGGWAKAQQTHFADGGLFDQVILEAKK